MGAIAKEFKTIEELVQLLESRGIATDEMTAKIIQKESYYAVVNGYKDSFLDKSAMQDHAHDVYKPGTTFNQIYSLFLFDRELRWTLFPYLTTAETVLKNAIVYAFCERYRDPMAYLDRANYASAKDMLVLEGFKGNKGRLHSKSLADLMARFNGKIAIDGGPTRPFIRHYMEEYGFVPLWVLQNDLTFGNIEHFYQLQKRGVQNAACRIVSEITGRSDRRIGARDLLRSLTVLVFFRNICAHDDRFYCASIKGMHADSAFEALGMVLTPGDWSRLHHELGGVMERFRGAIDPRALNCMYSDESDIPSEFR